MDEYELPQENTEARTGRCRSRSDGHHGPRSTSNDPPNYVLGVVLFAVALFFAGMSTKLRGDGVRKALLAVGCAVFIGDGGVDRHLPGQHLRVACALARMAQV